MNFFKRKTAKSAVLSPLNGTVVPVTETPDPVFSGKVLGDGIAIIPESNEVVAPASGTIVQIAHTCHAICLQSDDGLEILIHLGIDTVELKKEGFTCYVKSGEHVEAGQKLMDMDIDFIRSKGYNPISPCIITNMDQIKETEMYQGRAQAGVTQIIKYEKK